MSKEQIKSIVTPILKKYGVLKAALFGSVVRGEATENSDVDLLVEFEDGRSLLDLVGLQLDLKELLKMNVDVVTYNALNPRLKDSILKDQEPFYEATTPSLS